MDVAVLVALIAAIGAIGGHLVTQYATYRLKLREFRITQVKARIDTLEQALIPDLPDRPEETSPRQNIIDAAFNMVLGTQKQYRKYKWLLVASFHKELDTLSTTCDSQMGPIVVANQTRQPNFDALIVQFHQDGKKLHELYEKARLETIARLYKLLDADIGI